MQLGRFRGNVVEVAAGGMPIRCGSPSAAATARSSLRHGGEADTLAPPSGSLGLPREESGSPD
jgi:hypothetical protein